VKKLCAALLACLLPLSGAAALDLEAVLERVMVTPPSRVAFRELRYNEMFAESFELTGYLEYLEDGQMRKVIKTPFEESFLVRKDRVEIERHGETQVLPINRSRSLKAMLGGIEAILAGDTERLEKVFRHELAGDEAAWSLQLTPKSRRVGKQLKGLTVQGDGESVTSIRFEMQGGEWHLMDILREPAEQ
jgi:hypothetical protein